MDPRDSSPNFPSEALRAADPVSVGDDVPQGISVAELIDDPTLDLRIVAHAGRAGLDRRIRNARVQKSGLALVGHFHGLESWRLQILGATEISFLESLDAPTRARACDGFTALRPCAVVVTRGVQPLAELVEACERHDTPLLVTDQKSSSTINAIHSYLDDRLAPRARIHGVLVSIFGIGVLLLGRSGIGKSECALDLVMRGHRLVADDVVDCALVRVSSANGPARKVVVGAPAALLEHHIEIRGLGILNVKDLFGVTAVCERIAIDLVVKLSDAAEGTQGLDFDRLGVDERHHDILGVAITEVTIPVRPGRDIAAILQIAARNELLKRAGHYGARAFRDRLEQALLGGVADIGGGKGGAR
ncbi:MAG: HPr(Ser) kinase/phosphatase [Deltaproteobacteria bacterium]|nr:HPr(Ser) kinase/phosphatase [Deltaproteobacteria bacterium]